MQFMRESMRLARNRAIKVRGYFRARDMAAVAAKLRKSFYNKMKAAKSLAAATKAMHIKAMAH